MKSNQIPTIKKTITKRTIMKLEMFLTAMALLAMAATSAKCQYLFTYEISEHQDAANRAPKSSLFDTSQFKIVTPSQLQAAFPVGARPPSVASIGDNQVDNNQINVDPNQVVSGPTNGAIHSPITSPTSSSSSSDAFDSTSLGQNQVQATVEDVPSTSANGVPLQNQQWPQQTVSTQQVQAPTQPQTSSANNFQFAFPQSTSTAPQLSTNQLSSPSASWFLQSAQQQLTSQLGQQQQHQQHQQHTAAGDQQQPSQQQQQQQQQQVEPQQIQFGSVQNVAQNAQLRSTSGPHLGASGSLFDPQAALSEPANDPPRSLAPSFTDVLAARTATSSFLRPTFVTSGGSPTSSVQAQAQPQAQTAEQALLAFRRTVQQQQSALGNNPFNSIATNPAFAGSSLGSVDQDQFGQFAAKTNIELERQQHHNQQALAQQHLQQQQQQQQQQQHDQNQWLSAQLEKPQFVSLSPDRRLSSPIQSGHSIGDQLAPHQRQYQPQHQQPISEAAPVISTTAAPPRVSPHILESFLLQQKDQHEKHLQLLKYQIEMNKSQQQQQLRRRDTDARRRAQTSSTSTQDQQQAEQLREAQRREAEKREVERREAERRDAERREAERREAERKEAEKIEMERLQAERREAQRREAERLENERLEQKLAARRRHETHKQTEVRGGRADSRLTNVPSSSGDDRSVIKQQIPLYSGPGQYGLYRNASAEIDALLNSVVIDDEADRRRTPSSVTMATVDSTVQSPPPSLRETTIEMSTPVERQLRVQFRPTNSANNAGTIAIRRARARAQIYTPITTDQTTTSTTSTTTSTTTSAPNSDSALSDYGLEYNVDVDDILRRPVPASSWSPSSSSSIQSSSKQNERSLTSTARNSAFDDDQPSDGQQVRSNVRPRSISQPSNSIDSFSSSSAPVKRALVPAPTASRSVVGLGALPPDTDEDGIPGRAGVEYPVLASIPTTSFTCSRQPLNGYYADTETACQVVHLCGQGGSQSSILCPNGTIFNQEKLSCQWWYEVDCSRAPQFYQLNDNLYKVPTTTNQKPATGEKAARAS